MQSKTKKRSQIKVWTRTEKRETLLYQRFSLFWCNILYTGFYAVS